MERFYIDFGQRLRESKRKLLIQILGAGLIITGVLMFTVGVIEHVNRFLLYDGIYQVLMGIAWLSVIFTVKESMWHFKVDDTSIEYRPQIGIRKRYYWTDIMNVEMKTGKVLLKLRDGRTGRLSLNTFSYLDRRTIRDAIETAAREKNLLSAS